MKTKKLNHRKPFHLHLDHFFRKKYCLLAVLALTIFAVIKSDGKALSIWRQAYAQGFGIIGQYMREETSRLPITVEVSTRVATTSAGA